MILKVIFKCQISYLAKVVFTWFSSVRKIIDIIVHIIDYYNQESMNVLFIFQHRTVRKIVLYITNADREISENICSAGILISYDGLQNEHS